MKPGLAPESVQPSIFPPLETESRCESRTLLTPFGGGCNEEGLGF